MEIKNYTLLEKKEIPEYQATGFVFRHNQTGAEVFYVYTPEDDNKVFSISFCTPPENDMGIPHILEHCVLNGSRKFPVKEPFVELLKGSLNTFLNAMTFPDKTMFPVASRNEQDFMNLVDVYLDAVLYPNLQQDPFILKQEGWHYELENEEAPLRYKGVVYNEMKGAYSSAETVLAKTIEKALYPQSIYRHSSGGDPDYITDLTYDEFRRFHQTYYHPANSYIFFYGNGDIQKHLAFVDQEYLQDFAPKDGEVLPARVRVQSQEPLTQPVEVEKAYAVAEGETTQEKTFLSYSMVIGTSLDPLNYYGLDFLAQILGGTEASPLKTALLKAGIGKEVYATADGSLLQPMLSVVARNANPEQKEEFVRIIQETLEGIVKNGLEPRLVEATLSSNEFALREASYGMPKGLAVNISCLDSWLHGESPMQLISYTEPIRTIRNTPCFFEQFIEKNVLNNTHRATVVLYPEAGLNARIERETREKLAAHKASLTPEEIQVLIAETQGIQVRQQTPDTPENLEKLPLLQKSDIDPKQEQYIAQKKTIATCPAYVYHDFTNQIAYVSLHFNMDHVAEADIPYAALLVNVLGMMDTAHYTYAELDNEIGCRLGGLSTDLRIVEKMDGTFTPYFYMAGKYLVKEHEAAFELMREILLKTKLESRSRLKEIVAETRSYMEKSMQRRGHLVASMRALSYFDAAAAYRERMGGIDFLRFMQDLEDNFEEKAEETLKQLQKVLQILVCRDNLSLRVTCEETEYEPIVRQAETLIHDLPQQAGAGACEQVVRVQPVAKNEGFITAGKVQYVAKAGKFSQPYHGSMIVMGHILSLDYLWAKVRAQGGAYGCFQGMDRLGRLHMESYRDPNLKRTIQVYEEAGAAMKAFTCSEREMTKYIIGAIAGLDPVRSAAGKGAAACDRLERGLTPEMLQQLREEVLATTPEQVQESAQALEEAMKQPYVCVQGSEEQIKENAELFDVVTALF